MRNGKATAIALAGILALSGCAAMQEREWGYCALGGGLLGAAMGAGTAGGLVNAYVRTDDGVSGPTAGAAVGGAVAGGALGALLGHLICDPEIAQPAPPPPPPPPARKHIELNADTYFDFNKSTLKPEGKKVIDDQAVAPMKEHPELRALVQGHTDSIGSEAYNMKLSERRANAVKDFMVSRGVSASRITTKGFGKTKPIADNKTAEGRAKNRRVEVDEE